MPANLKRFSTLICAACTAAACGGSVAGSPDTQTPAEKPVDSAESPKAQSSEAKAQTETEAEASTEDTRAEETAKKDPFRLVRSPKDIVTAGDTAFVLAFGSSEVGEQADAECREKAGNDKAAHTECLEKMRRKINAKILRFVNKNDQWWFVTYDQKGDQLIALHRMEFDFGEVTEQTVALLPKGKDKGLAPLARLPRQVVITVPNEYSIEVVDPIHGKLVYEAKIGILGT